MDAEPHVIDAVKTEETDIFAWTNNLVQYVDELKIDLYFFNKNHTVYRVPLQGDAKRQLRALFVDPILEYVLDGIDNGLMVRTFEEAESEKGVLQKTDLRKIEKMTYTLNWIKNEQHNIEKFVDSEHDLRRVKGVIAHCYHAELDKPFYVIKSMPSSQVMKGDSAWLLENNVFKPLEEKSALKIPGDNQLLTIGDDVFVFNQAKLKALFNYDAKAAAIALIKIRAIESVFRLSFEEGKSLSTMALGKAAAIRKLQNIDIEGLEQSDILQHAEEMDIDLMVDDSGAIIIADDKDLITFVNLINEDYIESPIIGRRYEVLSKKPLKPAKDE